MSTKEEVKQETQTLQAGTCTRDECRCIHEHGLVEVVDGNGQHSQMTVEQAQNELAKVESLKKALGDAK